MRDLVVSFYDEDLDWLQEITNHRLFIYDKSGIDYTHECQNHIKLPNIGRESHTYAYHIAANYESLAEWTIFTQGWPFDHCYYFFSILAQPDYESMIKIIKKHEWQINKANGFLGLSPFDVYYPGVTKWPWYYLIVDLLALHKYCGWPNTLFNEYEFSFGALLMVHRDVIHSRSKMFYEGLVDLHQNHANLPWALEIAWKMVFSKPKTLLL